MKISQTAQEAAERIARLANDPRLARVPFIAATLTAEIVQSAIDAELADLHAKDSVRTKEHNILTQENRRLAEDAARLDWLESKYLSVDESTCRATVRMATLAVVFDKPHDRLRAAIDAARKP